jgi:hypothetical protein
MVRAYKLIYLDQRGLSTEQLPPMACVKNLRPKAAIFNASRFSSRSRWPNAQRNGSAATSR